MRRIVKVLSPNQIAKFEADIKNGYYYMELATKYKISRQRAKKMADKILNSPSVTEKKPRVMGVTIKKEDYIRVYFQKINKIFSKIKVGEEIRLQVGNVTVIEKYKNHMRVKHNNNIFGISLADLMDSKIYDPCMEVVSV